MLDPLGRREVLEIAHRLNREQGTTVVAITHFMREAVDADRVVVMSEGQVVLQGTPREIFAQRDLLRELHLDVPPAPRLAAELHSRHQAFPADLLTNEELVEAVRRLRPAQAAPLAAVQPPAVQPPAVAARPGAGEPPVIEVEELTHFYMRKTPLEVQALFGVSLHVGAGEIVGIMGHTGSGKSTVIQHLNGLLRPHGGSVRVFGQETGDSGTDMRALRRRVGLVFQFPEAQLFEQYVGDDVAFGPRNLGLGREEVRERVRRAMEIVGLGFEEFKDRFTTALSGGQRRRVALAGVLALEPEVLVLDEPTAGLDPQGRRKLLADILAYHAAGHSLVIVSHNMEELAQLCDHIYVIAHGRTVLEGAPAQVFSDASVLRELGLDIPDITALTEALEAEGLLPAGSTITTVDEAVEGIVRVLGPQHSSPPAALP
jgi:energy-coupling factor transport system ATP-binding protein